MRAPNLVIASFFSQPVMASNGSTPSKRWTQFYAALQLAIQSAAHKWTSVSSRSLSIFPFVQRIS